MNQLIARLNATNEVKGFPLKLRRELRILHTKYYRLTFHKAGIFGDAVPKIGELEYSGTGDGYGFVASPRYNHIAICWDTMFGVVNATDLVLISQYFNELMAILLRYGYSPTAENPFRRIHIGTLDDGSFHAITVDFGIPTQFYYYEV